MTWIQIVRNIETPRLTSKIKYYLITHLSHFITIIVGLLLVYTIYTVFALRTLTQVEMELSDIYLNVLKVGTVLICFCIIFSRNKLKSNDYIFFYLNSNIKAYQTVVGSMFYLYLFCGVVLSLTFFPALLGIIIQGTPINLLYLFLLFLTLTLLFMLAVTGWMMIKVLLMKLTNAEKENFTLSTIGLVVIMFGTLMVVEKYLKSFLEQKALFYFILLVLSIIIVYLVMRKLATGFLTLTFQQKNAGNLLKRYSTSKLDYSNRYLLQAKVEFLNFFRNQEFKEQGLLYIILVITMIGTYYTFESTSFFTLYSFIVQFGLKEILIMLPLTIGIHYKKYKHAIYNLNIGKYPYFLSRVLFIYIVNCMIYFSFLTLTKVWFGVDIGGILSALVSIGFITMLSTLTSFVIKIDDFNKIFVIIFLLVFVNGFDLIIHQTVKEVLYFQFIYTALVFLIFFIIEALYIRRPIFK